jgi:F0F1-type ATP synthase epsilon subunit
VQVAKNVVSILTNSAVPAENLDASAAQDELSAARARAANSEELLEIRSRAQLRARAKIRLATRQRAR